MMIWYFNWYLGFFNLFTESEVDEIQQYALSITREKDHEDHSTSYNIHNLQSSYESCFYSNLIDIHIDDCVEICLNAFQLNAMITLLNSFMGEDQKQAGEKQFMESEALPGAEMEMDPTRRYFHSWKEYPKREREISIEISINDEMSDMNISHG